ncbi:MAG TPA: hypothetical protein DCW31_04905 [Lactobacillus sp.]|nr:hypothetical protein [Lactobacillus sp.]
MKLNPHIIQQADHYLSEHDYQTNLYEEKIVKKSSHEPRQQVTYAQGDRVRLNADGRQGLVYKQDKREQTVVVYVDDQFETVAERRVTQLGKAADLYPDGYDMSRLFKNYDDFKFQRDLDRGSMKAQKQLDKQMRQMRDEGKN